MPSIGNRKNVNYSPWTLTKVRLEFYVHTDMSHLLGLDDYLALRSDRFRKGKGEGTV